MFRNLEGWHFVVLVAVVVLLFGTKKLPDAARGLGRSLRIFKSEIKTMQDEETTTTATATTTTPKPASELPPTTPVTPVTPTVDTADEPGTTARETPPRVDG